LVQQRKNEAKYSFPHLMFFGDCFDNHWDLYERTKLGILFPMGAMASIAEEILKKIDK